MNQKKHSALAIPFITFNEDHFALSNEAQQFLLGLSEDRHLGIVSIVGKYRTGKSFFVNRVLLDQKKGGFQVGPTINPCTKGLWLWKKTIPSSSNQNMDIIMIDTEGFGGMDENANHDSRIFLFSLLLSSFFIYNSSGSIDENALNTLNLIINLAKDIQTKSNSTSDQSSNFPSFLWIVRDFALKMEDKTGNKINSKEYLENALEQQGGLSSAVEGKNKIRKLFKKFFQERDCEVMIRPTQKQKDLQRLDEMDNSQLRPEFVGQVEAIRSKIYKKVKPKIIKDKILNGNLLVSLIKGYIDLINKKMLPNVESAWFYVCRNQGMKAIKEASNFMEDMIENLSKNPIKNSQMNAIKSQLREQVLAKFKKRSLGSEEGHPDLLQKLQKKIDDQMNDLLKKNKSVWQQKYHETSEQISDQIKQKIFGQQYTDFSDFVKDFQAIKLQYDKQTSQGDPIQKWKHFNELSEQLYRLAGETITTKINKNLNHQKNMLQQKLHIQEEQLEERRVKLQNEKQSLKQKMQNLERQNSKLSALEESHKARSSQYKIQHDKLYEKYRTLFNDHEETMIQLEKLKKETKRFTENEMEDANHQICSLKSNIEKERALNQMEKKYMQEELQRYKDRSNNLENQNRRLRSTNAKISSDLEEIQSKFVQKAQQTEILEQTNVTYAKKIQNLLIENSKKNQLMNDQSEWILEKIYLENQVTFLKNTLNENKRLHDALLVALQQSISSSQGENNNELAEANKNLSSALEKSESRIKSLEEKYEKMRELKKVMKNCLSMQCMNCNKSIQTSCFSSHLEQCLGQVMPMREKTLPDSNKQNIHISVSQTIKESEDRKKAYTEYLIQISLGEGKWKIHKKYKEFSQLHQMLIHKFPSIKYPPSCNFLGDINNLITSKKNIMAEERRKSLQQYLRDLTKIQQIRTSDIFKYFLEFPDMNDSELKVTKKKPYDFSEHKEKLHF